MVVVFDPAEFKTIFPQFATVSNTQLQFFFNGACLILDNTDNSPVEDGTEREMLLYYLVCHLATLAKRGDELVGTISSASEGGVSTSLSGLMRDQNWYTQTQCGAMYWEATRKYRLGIRYI